MRKIDLKSLGISQDEVKAALARERRPKVRRRLVAVGRILAGKSIKQAARAAKTTPVTVDRWLERVRRSGFQSLLRDTRRRQPKYRMKPGQIEAMRRDIAVALQQPLKEQVRSRLVAIDMALSGQPVDDAAASVGVQPDTVRRWLRVISRDGVDATVVRWQVDRRLRPGRLNVDPATLHELAAKEINPRVRKRIRALACVAEGTGVYDAEVKVGLNRSAITKRVRRFREEGIAAFQDRKITGRPHKLTFTELEEVGRIILERPMISHAELRDLVWARFRVRYSLRRLRHLLKAKLGVQWKPARSHAGPVSLEARRTLAQSPKAAQQRRAATGTKSPRGRPRKLNGAQLEELRDYVLKRPDTSFWRLHRLVWNRFHVRHSHASLKRLLKSEFGIAWTGASKKLGDGLNLAELQGALTGATDWRMKKRLRALIDLAKGRAADIVARANRVHLETLRKWTKRYRRSGIEGLRGSANGTGDGRSSRASNTAS